MIKINVLLTLLVIVVLASCAPRRYCTPPKGSKDYAGQSVKTMLVSVHRTVNGYRHYFVKDNGDTITRFLNKRLKVDSCYLICEYEKTNG